MKADYPNKYLDVELNYMKEIREAYFIPKDIVVVEKEKEEYNPYEISEKSLKLQKTAPKDI